VRLEADAGRRTRRYRDQVPLATPMDRMTAWFRGLNPWAIDAGIGTLFTVLGLVGLFANDPHHYFNDPTALAVALSLGCTVPFYFRRYAPFGSLMVTVTALVMMFVLDYAANAQSQMVLVSVFSLASHGSGVKRFLGFALTELGVAIVAIHGVPGSNTSGVFIAGALYVAAYALGSALRNRRLYMEQLEERAVMLERERDDEARRAVADERLRIAQELHDVVAHSMGVIAVQAGVGSHVIDTDPTEAKKALDAISITSRSTLTEIRRLLGVLRDVAGAEYTPAPSLTDLPALAAELGAAGVPVDVRVHGERADVPPGVDFTAYRIVQEGLTNVLKHAGPARATVDVTYAPGAVALEIVDDGRGVNGRSGPGGHGLIGMRERVAVYGGSLETGPRVGGGYRVAATLPYAEAE